MANLLIRDKPYEKQAGTDHFAPYVDVSISSALAGRRSVDVNFKARIDTGADITCIPKGQAEKLMPLPLGRPVLIRRDDDSLKTARTYLVIISVHGYPGAGQLKSYRPERGVLLADSHVGLIGMDIIGKYWSVTFDGVSRRFSVDELESAVTGLEGKLIYPDNVVEEREDATVSLPPTHAIRMDDRMESWETYLRYERELLRDHKGKHVAIYGEEIVGIHDDVGKLAEMIYEKYGDVEALICKVEEEGEPIQMPPLRNIIEL
jgi:hypothetical protein